MLERFLGFSYSLRLSHDASREVYAYNICIKHHYGFRGLYFFISSPYFYCGSICRYFLSAGCFLGSVTDFWNPFTVYIPHAFQMRTYIGLLIMHHFFGIVGEALRNTWMLSFYSLPSLWKSLEWILMFTQPEALRAQRGIWRQQSMC